MTQYTKRFTKKQLREFARITRKYDKLKKPHLEALAKLMKREYEECMKI